MIDIGLLFSRVLLLLLMVLPGFAVRKADIINSSAPKTLADIVLYILQPAMLVSAFIRPFPLSDTHPAPCRVRGRPPARSG